MGIIELLLLSLGLAMDAFSVSVCKGLSMKKINYKGAVVTAAFFGVFQGVMPLIGYLLGSYFEKFITNWSHWIAFGLLGFIGGKMIYEVFKGDEEDESSGEYKLDIKELFILAIATSIDALAVGVIFVGQSMKGIILDVSTIGAITFIACVIGVVIGNRFGSKYEKKAQLAGGVILCLIGVKLLIDGLTK